MTDEAKVSIIIPFYNIAQDIFVRCIESVKKQTYTNIEIIVVDDGSKSEYASFLDFICSSTIRVIHKKNEGVSKARNTGIANAAGQYITFVDGDDYISPKMIEEGIAYIQREKCNIVVGRIKKSDNPDEKFDVCKKSAVYTLSEDRNYLLESIFAPELLGGKEQEWQHIMQAPVAKIIEKSLLENCLFPEEVDISEDTIWNYCLMQNCHDKVRVGILLNGWYIYYQNVSSTLHTYKDDFDIKILLSIKILNQYIRKTQTVYSVYYVEWILGKLQQIVEDYLLNFTNPKTVREKIDCLKAIMKQTEIMEIIDNSQKTVRQKAKFTLYKSGLAVLYYMQKKGDNQIDNKTQRFQ